ncbi:hypothetical protein PTKIN_Ptkin09bG0277400 [Pterospermum kingtungense]
MEIVPVENEGTLSSHEKEAEREEGDKVVQVQVTENVGQLSKPASTGVAALTTVDQSVSKILDGKGTYTVRRIERVSTEEALQLFDEQVGGLIDMPSIQHFAQGIVEGCCGLPFLIVVIGRAMAGEKNVSVWPHAFNEFSVLGRDIKSREELIQLLKFSFHRLKSQSLKSCFLYCALFSEDQEINTEEFIENCIQEGLIAAYERGYDIVDALLHAFFLETTDDGRSIRMRDVMRDLALGILSQEEGSQFLLKAYSSKPLNLQDHSLVGPHESTESNRLFIPDAHQFILRAGSGLTKPPSLEEWEKSKMIFLMDNKLSTLPERPSCPGLLTLFLQRNFSLRVIPMSFFDCMPWLKVLNSSNTRIKCLPETISKLISLETLILCHCERLAMLPTDIGSLKLLQILDLKGTEINILPDEIGELASLKYLDVCFYGSTDRNEYIKLPQGLISIGIISRLHALESLGISVCPGDERWNNISNFGIGNTGKLKYCIVSECPAVKAIVDDEDFTEVVFPCLERLSIHHLWNLVYIWEGVLPEGSFAMLRTLHVHACLKLKYVFKSSMLQFLSNLDELIVDDCTTIEKIIVDDMTPEQSYFSFSNFKRLTLHYLPALDNICEGAWPFVKYIDVYSCPNFKKINLDLELKHTLKEIKGEKNWWDALEWKEPGLGLHFEQLFTPVSEDDI